MLTLFRTVIAPEFASKTDAELTAMFDLVEQGINAAIFGSRFNEAVMLLAAHRFAVLVRLAGGGGGAAAGIGPVSSRSAGGLSIGYGGVSFAAKSWADSDLVQTPYGLQFLAIRDSRGSSRIGIC